MPVSEGASLGKAEALSFSRRLALLLRRLFDKPSERSAHALARVSAEICFHAHELVPLLQRAYYRRRHGCCAVGGHVSHGCMPHLGSWNCKERLNWLLSDRRRLSNCRRLNAGRSKPQYRW